MDIKKLVSQMTLEEKAGLCSGADFWHTKGVERLNIPQSMVSDGPHGLRKQDEEADHLGVNESIQAVCFPAGCASASSFDRELMYHIGETLGNECMAENVSVILGPAVNIKRSPLCGRNFEYYSEDPFLAGEMATGFIQGVQSQNVGTSIKHFAANNQEHERMSGSSEVSERALREIYLAPFEKAVKKAQPRTVMCSYNKINGTFASENHWLLTEVLRDEWDFKGYVMTDWGALNDCVKAIEAGLDLEMPGSSTDNAQLIAEAVKNGTLPEHLLDEAVERILNIVYEYEENKKPATFDREADHAKAEEFAAECMVLLKNEDNVLPLKKGSKVAFIGGFAKAPRYQGGGSSHIKCTRITDALSSAEGYADVIYAEGFSTTEDMVDEAKVKEALDAAAQADTVVVFAGLPDSFESEGYDRSHMRLPNCQNELIGKLSKVNPNLVVVLHNGSPVELPWIGQAKGVLEAYLGGEGVGKATVQILFGEKNPSGHLAESFPIRLEDNPSYLNFPGKGGKVCYAEDVFVGYRYYDAKKMPVLFPFGHGLSYTTFAYSNLKTDKQQVKDSDLLKVSVDVTNTGKMAGKAVVQLYVADETGYALRPVKELKEFAKIALMPGETKTVSFELSQRSYAYWDEDIPEWYAPSGTYRIMIGESSAKIVAETAVEVISTTARIMHVDGSTTIGELMANQKCAAFIREKLMPNMAVLMNVDDSSASEAISHQMEEAMARYMPLKSLRSFGGITNGQLEKIIEDLNKILQ